MRRSFFLAIILFPLLFNECKADKPAGSETKSASTEAVSRLTNADFKKLIFNYEIDKEWVFRGKKPAIIDFYADWCAPCRQLSPLVEEIAKEYAGKIDVYKVDTEKEKDLVQNIGISQLPTLLFIPVKGKPQFTIGYIPKEVLVKAVNEIITDK